MTDTDISRRLYPIRHVVLDMDGTIYSGKKTFDTTLPFLDMLKRKGIGYTFLTNNSSKSIEEYIADLAERGIHIDANMILTSTLAVTDYLKRHHPDIKKIHALGTDSFRSELEKAGFTITFGEPDAVVVGYDTTLEYKRLCKAAYWIRCGKLWLASHPDVECPTDDAMVLVDCGAIIECLKAVVGRAPDKILGKPAKEMLESIIIRYQLRQTEILMVGDRLNTDMQLAVNAGVSGVLIAKQPSESKNLNGALCSVTDLGELGCLMSNCVQL